MTNVVADCDMPTEPNRIDQISSRHPPFLLFCSRLLAPFAPLAAYPHTLETKNSRPFFFFLLTATTTKLWLFEFHRLYRRLHFPKEGYRRTPLMIPRPDPRQHQIPTQDCAVPSRISLDQHFSIRIRKTGYTDTSNAPDRLGYR